MSDTDPDPSRLSARLAAVERALTDRDCDCAHEAFAPHDPSASTTREHDHHRPTDHRQPTGHRQPTDDELRDAVVAVCEYVLARERATDPSDEHAAAVRTALDALTDAPSVAGDSPPSDGGTETGDTPREWLERVAAAVFE